MARLIEKSALWTVVLLVAFLCANGAYSIHQQKNGLRDLATHLHAQCVSGQACPAAIPGWQEVRPHVFSNHGFRYTVAEDGKTFQLSVHHGPDWDSVARAGVKAGLTFENRMD